MASIAKQISLFFLVFLLSFFQVQARESKFFNKFTHLASSQNLVPHIEVPASAPSPSPIYSNIESQNPNYGLYGLEAGSDDLPVATTTTINENDLLAEKFASESHVTGYENNNHNNNGYFPTTTNNNNGYYYNNRNGYEGDERQGMSDTRFMEGGRYHYDLNSERKPVINNYEGYYRNAENFDEFNSINKFENQQDRFYQENQEGYVP